MAHPTTTNELNALIARGEYMVLLADGMATSSREDEVISALALFMGWKLFGNKSTEETFLLCLQFSKAAVLAGKEIGGAKHE